jgi:uncharacterized protein YjbJ (UPF0337 family)
MNKDRVAGMVEHAVGKVKQGVGEALGNQDLANRGVLDQAAGGIKETWGNAKDAAKQIHDAHKDETADKADETRHSISDHLEKAKDKLNEKIEDFKQRHTA